MKGELLNKTVVQVAASDCHSACVAEDCSVYSWGDNGDGQLGVPSVYPSVIYGADLPVLMQTSNLDAIE